MSISGVYSGAYPCEGCQRIFFFNMLEVNSQVNVAHLVGRF